MTGNVPSKRHDDGGRTDDRGPEILQEQVDHQHHEDERLEESVNHLVDREAHELGRVERHQVVEAVGEARLHPLQGGVDRLRDLERVGARLLVDRR